MPIIEIPEKSEDEEKVTKTIKSLEKLGKEDNFIITIRRDRYIQEYRTALNAYEQEKIIGAKQALYTIAGMYEELAHIFNNRLPEKLKVKIE